MKRILNKESVLIILFLLSACLVMIGVFYYDMHSELSTKEDEGINELRTEYRTILSKYESMAKIYYSQIDNMKELKDLFDISYDEKNLIKKHFLREKSRTKLIPVFDDIKRNGFYDIKLHFKDGTNFIRMREPDKFGDKVDDRRMINLSNKNHSFTSGLEKGRSGTSQRYIFSLYSGGDVIGTVEFTVSLRSIMESLLDLYGNIYQIVLKKDDEFVSKNKIWCNSEDFITESHSNKNIENIIKNCDQRSLTIKSMLKDKSFTSQLVFNRKEYFGIFYSILNSEGEKSGFLIKVEENSETSLIYDDFLLNSSVNILITIMLIILILSYNSIHGRVKEMKMFDAMVVTANHEIKQPLTIISSYIELMMNNENLDKKTKDKLSKIGKNADKIDQILEKFREIEDPAYVDYANFTKMIDIDDKNRSSIES